MNNVVLANDIVNDHSDRTTIIATFPNDAFTFIFIVCQIYIYNKTVLHWRVDAVDALPSGVVFDFNNLLIFVELFSNRATILRHTRRWGRIIHLTQNNFVSERKLSNRRLAEQIKMDFRPHGVLSPPNHN